MSRYVTGSKILKLIQQYLNGKEDDNYEVLPTKKGGLRIIYIANKLVKYNTTAYPFNTLLVLDDFAGSDLLTNPNSELCRLLTKTRHYNLTCIIAIQTLRFVCLNIKRMATDLIIYSGFSKEDFESMLAQTSNNLDRKKVTSEYLAHRNIHDKFILNIAADKYYFDV